MQKGWWQTVDTQESLRDLVPAFERPELSSMEAKSGADFKRMCATLEVSQRSNSRLEAGFTRLGLKCGPLFYTSCPRDMNGRPCRKRLEADGECPRCLDVIGRPVPYLHIRRGKFSSEDGSTMSLSALGPVAEVLLGKGGEFAEQLEAQCEAEGDADRNLQEEAFRDCLGRKYDLAITAEMVASDDKPFVSATIYAAMPVSAVELRAGEQPETGASAKRMRAE